MRANPRRRQLSSVAAVIAVAVLVVVAAPAYAAWEPTKPVEFIVPAGAGGASDQMARTIQGIILKHKLLKQPVMIFTKGGASGAEGAMDVRESKGDPHKLLVAFSLIYTLPIAQNLPLSWDNFNPVAMVALDDFILWVNSDAPYKTAKEYVDAIKAAPDNSFKAGGTGSKREDQIITVAFEKDCREENNLYPLFKRWRSSNPTGWQTHRFQRQQPQRERCPVAGRHGARPVRLLRQAHGL